MNIIMNPYLLMFKYTVVNNKEKETTRNYYETILQLSISIQFKQHKLKYKI